MKKLPGMNFQHAATAALLLAATAAAQPKTLYWAGGSSHIADGTPLPTLSANLHGTWDAATRNWSVDAKGSRYVAWENGTDRVAVLTAFANVGGTANITLKTDVTLNQLRAPHDLNPTTGGHNMYYLYSETGVQHTVTLDGDRPMIHVFTEPNNRASLNNTSPMRTLRLDADVLLAAPRGFDKTGIGRLVIIDSADQVIGRVYLEDAYGDNPLVLPGIATTSMGNADTLLFRNNSQFEMNWPSAQPNKFNPNAVIHLAGSSRVTPSNYTAAGNRNLRQIVLENQGVLNLGNLSGTQTLTLADGFLRGADGIGTLYVAGSVANLAGLIVPNGPSAGTPLPWTLSDRARPLQFNSSRRLEEAPIEKAPEDLQDWDDGKWYNLGDPAAHGAYVPFNGPLPSVTVASLGIWNTSSGMVLPIADGAALNITSGHLSMHGGGVRTITGGSITTTTNELYIHQTGGNDINNRFVIESAIIGAMHVVKAGLGRVDWTGSSTNTYSGTTYAHFGRIVLNNRDGVPAIPGNVVVNRRAEVELQWSEQLGPNSRVTLREGGLLNSNNGNGRQTFAQPLVFENGTFSFAGDGYYTLAAPGDGLVFANGGLIRLSNQNSVRKTFNLLTNLRYEAASSNQAVFAKRHRLCGQRRGQPLRVAAHVPHPARVHHRQPLQPQRRHRARVANPRLRHASAGRPRNARGLPARHRGQPPRGTAQDRQRRDGVAPARRLLPRLRHRAQRRTVAHRAVCHAVRCQRRQHALPQRNQPRRLGQQLAGLGFGNHRGHFLRATREGAQREHRLGFRQPEVRRHLHPPHRRRRHLEQHEPIRLPRVRSARHRGRARHGNRDTWRHQRRRRQRRGP
jgi:hypothetical protein